MTFSLTVCRGSEYPYTARKRRSVRYRHRTLHGRGSPERRLFDDAKFKLIKRERLDATILTARFPEADLILLEGFKHSPWPKLELVRAGNSNAPVCEPDTLLALVTDPPINLAGVPRLPFEDAARSAERIVAYVKLFFGHLMHAGYPASRALTRIPADRVSMPRAARNRGLPKRHTPCAVVPILPAPRSAAEAFLPPAAAFSNPPAAIRPQ